MLVKVHVVPLVAVFPMLSSLVSLILSRRVIEKKGVNFRNSRPIIQKWGLCCLSFKIMNYVVIRTRKIRHTILMFVIEHEHSNEIPSWHNIDTSECKSEPDMGFFVESKMLRLLSLMILIMDLIFFSFFRGRWKCVMEKTSTHP